MALSNRTMVLSLSCAIAVGILSYVAMWRWEWILEWRHRNVGKLVAQGIFLFAVLVFFVDSGIALVPSWRYQGARTLVENEVDIEDERRERELRNLRRELEATREASAAFDEVAGSTDVALSDVSEEGSTDLAASASGQPTEGGSIDLQLRARLESARRKQQMKLEADAKVKADEAQLAVAPCQRIRNRYIANAETNRMMPRWIDSEVLGNGGGVQKRVRDTESALAHHREMQRRKEERSGEGVPGVRPGEELRGWVAPQVREAQRIRAQQRGRHADVASAHADLVQDADLAESERVDSERASANQRAADLAERQLAQEKEREREEEEAKIRYRDSLPEEPPLEEEGRVVVALRLPNGRRMKRGWRRRDKVKDLYNWFHSLDDTRSNILRQLSTTFPRQAMPEVEWGEKTLSEAGLEAQTLLVVEAVDQ